MIKADFGEQIVDDVVAHNGERGRSLHNVYAFLYNKCVYEAAQQYAKNGPFLFSRASWIGCQRFPSQWGGDPQADWEGLAASLRGGLSWGMTGAPYYATDIGGFYGDQRDPKLYVRWLQASVFSAHLRMHGIGPREPWTYGPVAEAAATHALKLRYRLLPYIKKNRTGRKRNRVAGSASDGASLPRRTRNMAHGRTILFGEDLLVAPCINENDNVRIYLPAGNWRRFPDNTPFEGGRTYTLHLNLDEMAVFARDGAAIPLGPEIEYISAEAEAQPAEIWRAEG